MDAPSFDERPFAILGQVKSKVNYPSMQLEEKKSRGLCQNYFNKGANNLLRYAKKAGADTVANIRSVVFYFDGKSEEFRRAECADDGVEGQVLMIGDAIKWKPRIKKDDEIDQPRGVTRSLAHPKHIRKPRK
jgi:hypothetical protein